MLFIVKQLISHKVFLLNNFQYSIYLWNSVQSRIIIICWVSLILLLFYRFEAQCLDLTNYIMTKCNHHFSKTLRNIYLISLIVKYYFKIVFKFIFYTNFVYYFSSREVEREEEDVKETEPKLVVFTTNKIYINILSLYLIDFQFIIIYLNLK